MNKINFLAILIWTAIGLYGIIFNITYIDEAKYLIKGWLMTTGQVGYYSTPEFFYQHLPGSLLWYGLGQQLFGPSLLIARIQSFLIGLLILFFSYQLTGAINSKAKKNILPLLILAPVVILYYSSAVPQSLAALALVLAFYWLFKKQDNLATIGFTLAFIIRENFLFTLIFYLLFQHRFRHLILSLAVATVFLLPGWPGTIQVLRNFPGVSWLMPVTAAEKTILGLNWQQQAHSLELFLRAIKEFSLIYLGFLIVFIRALRFIKFFDRRFTFLVFIAGFNFLAHTWSAFNLSPRAIIPYLAYIFPLLAVITAVNLAGKKIQLYRPVLLLALAALPLSSIFQLPGRGSTIAKLSQSAQNLQPVISGQDKIIWIAEPMSLYLAGQVAYYPLINHTNFYKPSHDTATVKRLGFWNLALLDQWLNQADLLVIDPNRLNFAGINLDDKLDDRWQMIAAPANVWPENLQFYLPKSSFTTVPEASPLEK